jgi:hypothetical protein
MWSLSKTHQVGELIAAIAVVISLIFVGIQIRDNTIASKAATYQETVAYDMQLLLTVGSTPDVARVFFTFVGDPSSLDENEFLQGRSLFTASIRNFENLYVQHEAGMLSDEAWATREPLIRNIILSPGFGDLIRGSTGRNMSGPFFVYAQELRSDLKDGEGSR